VRAASWKGGTAYWSSPRWPDGLGGFAHGVTGIGLSALDLAANGWAAPANVLDRAMSATRRYGFGWNHTLCHGDLGCWELLSGGPPDADRRLLAARIIASLERTGPVIGLARDAFTPGLLPGLGGIAYQLLRLHAASDLPSALIQS
jgi:lantibiotic modifying enzyme